MSSKITVKWFLEAFTKKYYKKHSIVTVFFYSLLGIAVYSFIQNKTYLSGNDILSFLVKMLFLIVILITLKIIFEKNKW